MQLLKRNILIFPLLPIIEFTSLSFILVQPLKLAVTNLDNPETILPKLAVEPMHSKFFKILQFERPEKPSSFILGKKLRYKSSKVSAV